MAKRYFPKVNEIVVQAFETYSNLNNPPEEKPKEELDIIVEIKSIVNTILNTGELLTHKYNEIIRCYPRTKPVLAELIHQARIFSFYPHALADTGIKFNYDAYLDRIERLL